MTYNLNNIRIDMEETLLKNEIDSLIFQISNNDLIKKISTDTLENLSSNKLYSIVNKETISDCEVLHELCIKLIDNYISNSKKLELSNLYKIILGFLNSNKIISQIFLNINPFFHETCLITAEILSLVAFMGNPNNNNQVLEELLNSKFKALDKINSCQVNSSIQKTEIVSQVKH